MTSKRRRAGTIRRAVILSLAIGFVFGCVCTGWMNSLARKSDAVDQTVQATEAPAAEVPAVELTVAEETEQPVEETPAEETFAEEEVTEEAADAELTVTEEPTEEPTEAPTAEPTEEPTPEPTEVPEVITKQYRVSKYVTADILVEIPEEAEVIYGDLVSESDTAEETPAPGIVEVTVTDTPEPTATPDPNYVPTHATISVTVMRYMDPDYYNAHYGATYELSGTEASVEMQITLQASTDGVLALKPQEVFDKICIVMSDGTEVPGYSLLDAEISTSANSNPTVNMGATANLYKFFDYTSNSGSVPQYLRVVSTSNNVECIYDFELGDAESGYTLLQTGDKSEDVKSLQILLIRLGYLTGEADGAYGTMTAEAVAKAQADLGLAQTGIADVTFQKMLNAMPVPAATEAPAAAGVTEVTGTADTAAAADTADTATAADTSTIAPDAFASSVG